MNKYIKWLATWFANREPNIKLNPDDNYFSAGVIDSLGVIELIEEMEEAFLVKFTQDDFQDERFISINGLVEMIREKINL